MHFLEPPRPRSWALWTARRSRSRTTEIAGILSVAGYLAVLVVVALDPTIDAAALASSPSGVAAGKVSQLLTSGLVIDGPAWPQIAVLAAVLAVALRRLGPVRLWSAAICAHVGGTLVAYAALWLLSLGAPQVLSSVAHAPDYGISVVLTGELGALTRARTPRLVGPGLAALSLGAAIPFAVTGLVDPFVLASVEHLLGFAAGALMPRARSRGAVSRRPE